MFFCFLCKTSASITHCTHTHTHTWTTGRYLKRNKKMIWKIFADPNCFTLIAIAAPQYFSIFLLDVIGSDWMKINKNKLKCNDCENYKNGTGTPTICCANILTHWPNWNMTALSKQSAIVLPYMSLERNPFNTVVVWSLAWMLTSQ